MSKDEVQSLEVITTPEKPQSYPVVRETGNMTDLLFLAVERGVSAADLKDLVSLHRDMDQRQAQQDFSAALSRFQAECPRVKKGKTAKFTTRGGGDMSYAYASLDQIAEVVNPILAKHGLSYSFDSTVEGGSITTVCTVRHANGFSLPSTIRIPTASPSAMSDQQKVGSALTFAKRLSLTSALGITTADDDTDGGDTGDEISAEQVKQLEDLIQETGADAKKFLVFMKAENLAAITDFEKAKKALSAKKRKASQ